ncbi:MFS transporter [Streptomyces sp. NPDC002067]
MSATVSGDGGRTRPAAVPGTALGGRFRLLLGAAVATRFADAGRTAAFALAATVLSGDPRVVSAVAAASVLPWLLFGLPAGALVDRCDKRRAFFTADLSRALLATGLAVAALTGHLSVALVLCCAFALTTLQTVSDSCFNSLLPAFVPKESLGQANARLSMAQNGIGQFAGAPAGSTLFTWQPFLPFAGNALCFLGAAAAVRGLPPCPPAAEAGAASGAGRRRSSIGADVRVGLRWIATTPLVRALTLTVGIMNLASGLSAGIMPLFALHTLGMPRVAFGALAGVAAAAMIGGNFLAGRLIRRMPPERVSRAAVLTQIAAFAGLALAPGYPVALCCVALQGFTAGLWNVPGMTLLMEHAPADLRGRIMAAYRTLSMSAVPLGAVLAGALAYLAGNRAPFAVAALCLTVAAAQFVTTRHRATRPDRA